MWFKQIQLYQLNKELQLSVEDLISKLEPFIYSPCLPSMPQSMGWVSPIDEDESPLIRSINGNILLCLKVEEKILPASVIRHELAETIKQVETGQNRKLSQKEKLSLKDEIVMTMLPRAFSRFSRIYAYIDTKNHQLVLGTTNGKKIEQFIAMFRKAISDEVNAVEFKKLSYVLTYWLKNKNYPMSFAIENSCVLQDPQHETRIVRCKDQDLSFQGIQAFIKDGYEAIQLGLSWNDSLNFVLSSNFSFSSINFQDETKEQLAELNAETKQQQFDGDFLIMTGVFSGLLNEITTLFSNATNPADDGKVIPMARQANA